MTGKKSKIKPIHYSENLEVYLKEVLRLEAIKHRKKIGDKSKITVTDERDIKLNDGRKRIVLDNYIFKSMANLIYFFEFINDHPDLINKFDKDIEDLLGLYGTFSKSSPFSRLIKAFIGRILGTKWHDDSNDDRFNFRRRLLTLMQILINQKVMFYTANSQKGIVDRRFSQMIVNDMQRAEVWTLYLDKYVDYRKNPSRVIDV
jgi:hypothetical protein